MLSDKQLEVLMRPLHPGRVKTRTQGGASLSYLEAWDVKATLIRLFGFGGFSAVVEDVQIADLREVPQSRGSGTNWKASVLVRLRLTIPALDAVYTEAAVGSASLPDIGQSLDMATKTAESDALKRAATYLGTQFGLGLYNNGSTGEVVQLVFAPGQEWDGKKLEPEQKQALAESIGLTPPTGGETSE